ncbi:hypothetical protein PS914_04686 [Pseudomonas fluorescens]|uniref:pyocin S6 family toxin immunity protein n=1 Tax=Pseudomonas fluorescens TaxID=294 RepID=UPI001242B428|nr:pyocin S6 family toxin immunity protein [Pseudomonas fluorescens]VVQ07042.1 hypothetical protein PS914_04686 [Pseudomonas fluorescens]
MFLWISGFLRGSDEDDSLQYCLSVKPEHEEAVMRTLDWKSLDESPDGEWLLTIEQIQQITAATNEKLPTGLDMYISVRV